MNRILTFVLAITLLFGISATIIAQQATKPKLNKDEIIALQKALIKTGVNKSKANGIFNAATGNALRQYQKNNNLEVTGEPTEEILTKLGVPSIINVDNYNATGDTIQARSLIQVTWNLKNEKEEVQVMVVQAYKNGKLIFPSKNPHEENSPGVQISLKPGLHEIKLWIPNAESPYKSLWVKIK